MSSDMHYERTWLETGLHQVSSVLVLKEYDQIHSRSGIVVTQGSVHHGVEAMDASAWPIPDPALLLQSEQVATLALSDTACRAPLVSRKLSGYELS